MDTKLTLSARNSSNKDLSWESFKELVVSASIVPSTVRFQKLRTLFIVSMRLCMRVPLCFVVVVVVVIGMVKAFWHPFVGMDQISSTHFRDEPGAAAFGIPDIPETRIIGFLVRVLAFVC